MRTIALFLVCLWAATPQAFAQAVERKAFQVGDLVCNTFLQAYSVERIERINTDGTMLTNSGSSYHPSNFRHVVQTYGNVYIGQKTVHYFWGPKGPIFGTVRNICDDGQVILSQSAEEQAKTARLNGLQPGQTLFYPFVHYTWIRNAEKELAQKSVPKCDSRTAKSRPVGYACETSQGFVFTKINHPVFGISYRDDALGRVWSPQIGGIHMANVKGICENIGGRLPSAHDFNLALTEGFLEALPYEGNVYWTAETIDPYEFEPRSKYGRPDWGDAPITKRPADSKTRPHPMFNALERRMDYPTGKRLFETVRVFNVRCVRDER